MRYTTATIAVLAASLTNAAVILPRADCQLQENSCRNKPEANQATVRTTLRLVVFEHLDTLQASDLFG